MRESLHAIVGAEGVLTPSQVDLPEGFHPLTAVAPTSEAEVVSLLECAVGLRFPLIVGGSATHLSALNPHPSDWWFLCTRRLNRVVDYSPEDLVITVGAGMTLAELQAHLRRHRQYLPWNVPLPECATIGGIVASNRAGSWRYQHGTPRDRLLAVRAVRGDGVAFKSGAKVVKSVAGYDLHRLLCGSWGTLAVLTEITLKVSPLPQTMQAVGWYTSWEQLEPTLAELMRAPLQPDGISVICVRGQSGDGGVQALGSQALLEADRPNLTEEPTNWGNPMGWLTSPPSPLSARREEEFPDCHAERQRSISETLRSAQGDRVGLTSPPSPLSAGSAVGLAPTPQVGTLLLDKARVAPSEQVQAESENALPRPFIVLEFSGSPEGIEWQVRWLREHGFPAEPIASEQLEQWRDLLAPRAHTVMVKLLVRPSQVAETLLGWMGLGVEALAHAGSGIVYLWSDEPASVVSILERLRDTDCKYQILNLPSHWRERAPRPHQSEAVLRLNAGIKRALDPHSILGAFSG